MILTDTIFSDKRHKFLFSLTVSSDLKFFQGIIYVWIWIFDAIFLSLHGCTCINNFIFPEGERKLSFFRIIFHNFFVLFDRFWPTIRKFKPRGCPPLKFFDHPQIFRSNKLMARNNWSEKKSKIRTTQCTT